jgi:N-methylhydantoinase A/oxoprolinase/acetone carboxylase beta subunit
MKEKPITHPSDSSQDPFPYTSHEKIGLGIDAGGTYTDVVLYDKHRQRVLQSGKTRTTHWNYTEGIQNALGQLDSSLFPQIQMVAISTTLATNTIVEQTGLKVGLLAMAAYGMYQPGDIEHHPIEILSAEMEIDGVERKPVNTTEVIHAVERLLERGAQSFAISAYAADKNPAHEFQIRDIIQSRWDYDVTCGSELSSTLNYRSRAYTAISNAKIIPRLTQFLKTMEQTLSLKGIHAPIMVVKGDGTQMSIHMALKKPVETILSGPAASVSGALALTKEQNAVVVDIGGTTTDMALIKDRLPTLAKNYISIGAHSIHTRGLDIRTVGLGGDSKIAWERGDYRIGPKRISPISWLSSNNSNLKRAFEYLEQLPIHYLDSSEAFLFYQLNREPYQMKLNPLEAEVISRLRDRPYSVMELAKATNAIHWSTMNLQRLETLHVINQGGLTPTDLLHIQDRCTIWDRTAAHRLLILYAKLSQTDPDQIMSAVWEKIYGMLYLEFINKQWNTNCSPPSPVHSTPEQAFLHAFLKGGTEVLESRVHQHIPIIGIGAPALPFLEEMAKRLDTTLIIPEYSAVANAVGAIASKIIIRKSIRISITPRGNFILEGVIGKHHFKRLEEATTFGKHALQTMIQEEALQAGTMEKQVAIKQMDKSVTSGLGSSVFLHRELHGLLIGEPDGKLLTRGS